MKMSNQFAIFAAFMMVGLVVSDASAAASLSDMALQWKKEVPGIAQAIKYTFFLGGLVLVGSGFFQLLQAQKSQQAKGPALASLGIGTLLLGVSAIITAVAGSLGIEDSGSKLLGL